MTLETGEFVRRFCLHILPERFVKIRHYGLLGNRQREERLAKARQRLGTSAKAEEYGLPETNDTATAEVPQALCPFCQKPTLTFVRDIEPQRQVLLP